MVGGQWVAHPGGIIDYEVNIVPEKMKSIRAQIYRL